MRLISKLILFFTFIFSAAAFADTAETYKIDPMHTYVLWRINHFGFSIQVGKFTMIDGTISGSEQEPEDCKVNATIYMNKLSTGIPKLDEHLESADFFDAKKFPTATFVSNKVEVIGTHTAKVYGMLTLHGVTKPVTLEAKLLNVGMHPMKNVKSVGFTATTTFKRSEFGIDKYLPMLGDEVQIDIGAEANLTK